MCDYETKDGSCLRTFNAPFLMCLLLCYLQMTYFMGIDLLAGFSLKEAMDNNNQCGANSIFENGPTDVWFEMIIYFGSIWEWFLCLGYVVLVAGYNCMIMMRKQ